MADPRFYDRLGPLTIEEIAALSGAAISDSGSGDIAIEQVAPIGEAAPGFLSYLERADILEGVDVSAFAGATILTTGEAASRLSGQGVAVLVHERPRAAFARAAAGLARPRTMAGRDAISPEARIAPDAEIGPGVVIGADVEIAQDVRIGANAVIAPGCRIGRGTRIGARASLACCDIGADCNILAGAVIGEAGFGVAISSDGTVDVPHLGSVMISDRVTIGANSCVDRGVFGATRIGAGSKIDNLCHVAHNVEIGENCMFAAYAGISGSTRIGDNVVFGGRVGVGDHFTIGNNVQVAGNSAVLSDLEGNASYGGAPAQPLRKYFREIAAIRRMAQGPAKKKKD